MKIELTKPLAYKGSELEALDLELENLTGDDVLSVESELRSQGVIVSAWEYSRAFLLAVGARACHIPAEELKGLSVPDFVKVVNAVLNFFAGTVMPE